MKAVKRFAEFIILLIALGAALYLNRGAVAEWWRTASLPELPVSVTFEQVVEEGVEEVEEALGEPVEEAGDEQEVEEVEIEAPADVDDVEAGEEIVALPEQEGEVLDDDTEEVVDGEEVVEDGEEVAAEPAVELPLSINLAVPFTPQAPHADWGEPYKESCEEASVYMVERYYEGEPEGLIEAGKADEAIQTIVAFEHELFGYYEDTTAEQTGVFAELMFGRTYELIEDPSVDDLKSHLVQGRPVIIPAAGRLLNNPHFTAPGPIYHMLVVRGYTEAGQFIVNDPGTYRGEAYLYDFDTLLYAMHDWNGGDEITDGRKVALVIYP